MSRTSRIAIACACSALCLIAGAPAASAATCAPSSSPYAAAITATPGLVSYWRLGESSGDVACDSYGSNAGAYSGGYTLGRGPPCRRPRHGRCLRRHDGHGHRASLLLARRWRHVHDRGVGQAGELRRPRLPGRRLAGSRRVDAGVQRLQPAGPAPAQGRRRGDLDRVRDRHRLALRGRDQERVLRPPVRRRRRPDGHAHEPHAGQQLPAAPDRPELRQLLLERQRRRHRAVWQRAERRGHRGPLQQGHRHAVPHPDADARSRPGDRRRRGHRVRPDRPRLQPRPRHQRPLPAACDVEPAAEHRPLRRAHAGRRAVRRRHAGQVPAGLRRDVGPRQPAGPAPASATTSTSTRARRATSTTSTAWATRTAWRATAARATTASTSAPGT